jgi:hypothetical protein
MILVTALLPCLPVRAGTCARVCVPDAPGAPLHRQTWVEGQNIEPELLAAKKVRVKVNGVGEGVVQEFHKSKFCERRLRSIASSVTSALLPRLPLSSPPPRRLLAHGIRPPPAVQTAPVRIASSSTTAPPRRSTSSGRATVRAWGLGPLHCPLPRRPAHLYLSRG